MTSRQKADIRPVDEIWLITAGGEMTDKALSKVVQWHRGLPESAGPSLRIRKTVLEMCPSGNFQIVGFPDNYLPETGKLEPYPLKQYLDAGLWVTVNTDNPGISRTDFTRELHRAARMTLGGLSLWEILLLLRNSFRAAFIGADARHVLLRKAESEVIELIQEGLPL